MEAVGEAVGGGGVEEAGRGVVIDIEGRHGPLQSHVGRFAVSTRGKIRAI